MAGTNFGENTILANIYARALQDHGYKVELKPNLGSREVVEPALEKGDIDLYPGYAATDLEFQNKGAGEASSDIVPTISKLRQYLEPKGIKVLNAAPAVDQSAFVVAQATASKYRLKKLSDVAPVGDQLVFGASPQCPKRPFCLPGLERVYGIHFKAYKPLDAVGPLTRAALERGDIDIALLTTTDGAIAAKGWVVLEDDKHLELADNVVPIIRAKALNAEVEQVLNAISAQLTTDGLKEMNKRDQIDREDPSTIAATWLKDHKLIKK